MPTIFKFTFWIVFLNFIIFAEPVFKFAIFGQSNSIGHGGGVPTTAVDSAFEYDSVSNTWIHLEDPIGIDGTSSITPSFCNYLYSEYDNTKSYGIICGTIGGGAASGVVDYWADTTTQQYTEARSMVNEALNGDTLSAILFIGAEADLILNYDSAAFYAGCQTMIDNFRRDYGDSTLIMFSLPFRSNYIDTINFRVRAGMISCVDDNPKCHIVVDMGKYYNADGVHVTKSGLDSIGKAFGNYWINWQTYRYRPLAIDTTDDNSEVYVAFKPKDWFWSGKQTDNFPLIINMANFPGYFWTNITDDVTKISVFDQTTDAKIQRYITHFDSTNRTGLIYCFSDINGVVKGGLTIHYGASISESNDPDLFDSCRIDAYWPLDDSTTNAAIDLTETYNLTGADITWTTGILGYAPVWNGTTSELHCTGSVIPATTPTGTCTIEYLIKQETGDESGYPRLICNDEFFHSSLTLNDTAHFQVSRNGSTIGRTDLDDTIFNKWVLTTLVSKRAAFSYTYAIVGGKKYDTVSTGTPQAAGNLYIGNRSAADRTLKGSMQHVVVYQDSADYPRGWNLTRRDLFYTDYGEYYTEPVIDSIRCHVLRDSVYRQAARNGDTCTIYGHGFGQPSDGLMINQNSTGTVKMQIVEVFSDGDIDSMHVIPGPNSPPGIYKTWVRNGAGQASIPLSMALWVKKPGRL